MQDRSDGGIRPEAVLAVLLIISILMLVFTRILEKSAIRNYGAQVIIGIQRVAGKTVEQVRDGIGSLHKLRELRKEYDVLLNTFNDYQGVERVILELRRENEELRKQLGFSSSMKYEHIPAQVIAGDPSNLFASITLDKGIQDNIEVGMVVTTFQDTFLGLVGKVVAVGTRSCQVRPIIDPNHYVAARLYKSRFEGLIAGKGGISGELIMKYVPKSSGSSITTNDLVVTSGMQSIYPPGISIGRIQEVRSREYMTSLEIVVQPIVNHQRIEYVSIIKASPSKKQ